MSAMSSAQFINTATTSIVSKITLSPPKMNAIGGKSIAINNGKGHLVLPKMMCWGADEKEFDGKTKMSVTLQFPGLDKYKTPELTSVLDNFTEFEMFIKHQAIANSKEWFNKPKMSMDVVEALFTPILKYARNEAGEPNLEKGPSIQVKIPTWDGRCDSEIYDSENKMLFPNSTGLTIPDLIVKQCQIKTIITIGGIWFAGGKFGVTFKLFQAIIVPKTYLARGKCHYPVDSLSDSMGGLKIKDDPETARKNQFDKKSLTESMASLDKPPAAESLEPTSDFAGVEVAGSDEERDPEAEYTAAAEEAPVKGRKKVVKK